jgi:hypothetical protein
LVPAAEGQNLKTVPMKSNNIQGARPDRAGCTQDSDRLKHERSSQWPQG